MKNYLFALVVTLATTLWLTNPGFAGEKPFCEKCYANSPDFKITAASVVYNAKLDVLIFEMKVAGQAGATTPQPKNKDGHSVLGYVFPTTLKPEDVGFGKTEGIVALALTSHPDFDDSPLWDENNDGNYGNDGLVWHPHFVILVEDKRVKGGLSVKEFDKNDKSVVLPPTAPGMPMYMDSPGFNVVTHGNSIQVIVPAYRVNHRKDFKFDAVSCYMMVNSTMMMDKPMLGVYGVYTVLSGNLSLPYGVKIKQKPD
jgi:hypothetical protein